MIFFPLSHKQNNNQSQYVGYLMEMQD